MKADEVLEALKGAIASTRKAGVTQVTLDDLEAFAGHLTETAAKTRPDVAAGEAAMEAYKADLTAWVSARQQRHEYNLEMLRSVITTGQAALKSSLLINGGAAAALLAFIGSIWSTKVGVPSQISQALFCYVMGVLSAAFAAGATYFSQAGYGQEFGKWSLRVGRAGHVLAILGVLGSVNNQV